MEKTLDFEKENTLDFEKTLKRLWTGKGSSKRKQKNKAIEHHLF